MTTPYSENQDRIVNAVGIDDWDEIILTFAGLMKNEVLRILDEMDLPGNPSSLATLIVKEMPRYLSVSQTATFVDITNVAVRKRCVAEKEELGAIKYKGNWYLPADVARNLKRIGNRR